MGRNSHKVVKKRNKFGEVPDLNHVSQSWKHNVLRGLLIYIRENFVKDFSHQAETMWTSCTGKSTRWPKSTSLFCFIVSQHLPELSAPSRGRVEALWLRVWSCTSSPICWNTSTFIVKVEAFFRNTVTHAERRVHSGDDAYKDGRRGSTEVMGRSSSTMYFAKFVYLVYLNDPHQPKALTVSQSFWGPHLTHNP